MQSIESNVVPQKIFALDGSQLEAETPGVGHVSKLGFVAPVAELFVAIVIELGHTDIFDAVPRLHCVEDDSVAKTLLKTTLPGVEVVSMLTEGVLTPESKSDALVCVHKLETRSPVTCVLGEMSMLSLVRKEQSYFHV